MVDERRSQRETKLGGPSRRQANMVMAGCGVVLVVVAVAALLFPSQWFLDAGKSALVLDHPQLEMLGRVALAILLGAAVGLDRELAGKPAGLRTHMLVTGASTLLVSLGGLVVQEIGKGLEEGTVRSDPIRLIEAVVTGVSFLGAGTIMRRGNDIEGLTTAASILFAAAVGVTVAAGQIKLALLLTALVIVTLRAVGYLEQWLKIGRTPARGADDKDGGKKDG